MKELRPAADGVSDVINSIATTSTHQAVRSLTNTNDETIDMIIGRLERLERNKKSSNNFQSSKRNKSFIPVKSVCRHCSFINGQLRTNLNTNHSSQSCTRKKISVSVIESMDQMNWYRMVLFLMKVICILKKYILLILCSRTPLIYLQIVRLLLKQLIQLVMSIIKRKMIIV